MSLAVGRGRHADLPAGGVAILGEDVAVAVAVMHRDPAVRHRAVDAALEIAVANIEEMDAAQRAGRLHFVAHEYAEDLTASFFVGQRVRHDTPDVRGAKGNRARPFTRRCNHALQLRPNLSTVVCY